MIRHPAFSAEPWCVRERRLHLDVLAQTESIFALSNGHLGLRGNLDEGEPYGLPGTYLNGVYESRRMPYPEPRHGDPGTDQSVVNVANGKIVRLLVDDSPLDVRAGDLRSHERVLDLRAGTLTREVAWRSPTGRTVRVASRRLVSLTQRAVAAIAYEVEAVDGPADVVVQSELVANEPLPAPAHDPRSASPTGPLVAEQAHAEGTGAHLVHRTSTSGIWTAAAVDHHVHRHPAMALTNECQDDLTRLTIAARLRPGERIRLVKFLAYGWSARRSSAALRDQVAAALTAARRVGWEGLLAEQRAYLDAFWDHADVEVDGDTEIQQAVRFALFQVLQASARAEGQGIPAKGLTGNGYDGHSFWDAEAFVLPVLTWTAPQAAADALRWRHATLPVARRRAEELHLRGAAFAWRTIAGEECSGYWPAGTAAFHVNASIADAVRRYVMATGDHSFEAHEGLELLVETARLWRSLGHHDDRGRYHLDGVTGPDEYSALADDNLYTNLMAAGNLAAAAEAAARHRRRARALGVDDEEAAGWRDAAASMAVPYDERLGVHAQAEGFTDHAVWDFAGTPPDRYPLMLHFTYFELYRRQVVKQADVVLAMHLRSEAFSDEQKARNFEYYEGLTVRDSSLSACTQAVLAAEVGHPALASAYLVETCLMDLEDLEHNTRDGLHVASLAGTWIALVAGAGGLRDDTGTLAFRPRLPKGLAAVRFTLLVGDGRLRVEVAPTSATYRWLGEGAVRLAHYREAVELGDGQARSLAVPAARPRPAPTQPPGREPARGLRAGGPDPLSRRGGGAPGAGRAWR